jgi:Flp pilus assembly pilin Flp
MDVMTLVLLHVPWLRAKLESERGAGLVEYGLLVGLLAIIALVAVKAFGQGVSSQFTTVTSSVSE